MNRSIKYLFTKGLIFLFLLVLLSPIWIVTTLLINLYLIITLPII